MIKLIIDWFKNHFLKPKLNRAERRRISKLQRQGRYIGDE